MDLNSEAILVLCSTMCRGSVQPLTAAEWEMTARRLHDLNLAPGALLDFTREDFISKLQMDAVEADRCRRLIDRSGSLHFELTEYMNQGIQVMTRADPEFPGVLRQRLRENCPSVLYYAGRTELLKKRSVGFAGAGSVREPDELFIRQALSGIADSAALTGGAKGIEQAVSEAALKLGIPLIECLSLPMMTRLQNTKVVRQIQRGNVLLLSAEHPACAAASSSLNRYRYVLPQCTVVVRVEKGKNDAFAGACDAICNHLNPVLCRDDVSTGNRELIQLGAIPIGDSWQPGDFS